VSVERPSEQEIARLREAFAADSDRTAPDPVKDPCPAPERIWDALDGALGPEALREIVDHVAVCPACAEEWRLAITFREEAVNEESEDGAAPAPGGRGLDPVDLPGRRLQVPAWLAAAAVAVLALGLGGIWWSTARSGVPGATQAPVYRQATEQQIDSLLPEGKPLSRAEPVLRWTTGPEGSVYDVVVSTEDLAAPPIAEASGLTEARYRIPADALAGLPAGAELLWQVDATTPDGKRISSKTFETRLE